ncbi:hypothetical protein [Pendulispora albinea]|uniref:Uncharacterized protein n=1 Tax=Pendulispora albinea TaxID=2741071 RepID=A0ABZ2M2P5_9BACT
MALLACERPLAAIAGAKSSAFLAQEVDGSPGGEDSSSSLRQQGSD